MAKKHNKPFTVDDLWRVERLGTPSLAPDGHAAVCALTRYSMDENHARSSLWLLPTAEGQAPRELTRCGEKDGQARWSPRGDLIAFVARREQEGQKDEEPQLYLIAPDGGEARRAAVVPTGVEAFRWFPDGRRIAFVSWVWPGLKAKAQAQRLKDWKARKETGYATSEAQYRYWDHHLPQDRVAHLHVLDLATGKVKDLFEGTGYELERAEPTADTFDISPDGRRIVFAHDPEAEKHLDNCYALAELELKSGRVTTLLHEQGWDFGAPRYRPDGQAVAFLARHEARKHTMHDQLGLWERGSAAWRVPSAEWDHAVNAPLVWQPEGTALYFCAEERARTHVWRFDLETGRAEAVVRGGTVHGFDLAGETLVSVADAMDHPAQASLHRAGAAPRRLERFNDELLAGFSFGRTEEVTVTGARGEDVQMWLVFPPNFDPKKKWPVLHSIHGGPHAASGDTFHYRWNNQVFANRGYVVACVNYHGSSGFGFEFLDSITHHWGEYELQDVEAGTDWILRQRWADPKRVFATGGSYGGYMVAWMNGHVPAGRYAAYVCHAGCFDWTAMFADDAYTWHAKEMGAWYWDDPAKVQSQSPHLFSGQMQTPTLVIHGALDYRVPDQQGLAYYNTLKVRGVDARLLWFPDENHWILKPRNSRMWYEEYFGWLQRHGGEGKARKR